MNRLLFVACATVLLPIISARAAVVDLLFMPVDSELRNFGPFIVREVRFTPTRDVELTGIGVIFDPVPDNVTPSLSLTLRQDDDEGNDDRLASIDPHLGDDFFDTGLNRYIFSLAAHPGYFGRESIILEEGRTYFIKTQVNITGQWPEQRRESQDFPFTTASGSLMVLGAEAGSAMRDQPPLVVELNTQAAPVPHWDVDANGEWSIATTWRGGVPNGDSVHAVFGAAITERRAVTLNEPITVGRIDLNNANAYSIGGSGLLTFDSASGDAVIDVVKGSHSITAPVNVTDDTVITVRPATSTLHLGALVPLAVKLTKDGPGTLTVNSIRAPELSLKWGTVKIAPNGDSDGTSLFNAISLMGGTLDLTNNAAVIDYSGSSPIAAIRQQIGSGRGGPGLGKNWDGQGITSSTAAAAEPESRSVAYAENSSLPLGPYSSFRGQPVDDTAVLMTYTRTGDANLDGVVNDDDVTIVSATYLPGVPNPHWALGDFDYDGFIDEDDVTLLGVFYDPSATPLGVPEALSAVAVPEPAGWLMLALGVVGAALTLLRRSRCGAADSV